MVRTLPNRRRDLLQPTLYLVFDLLALEAAFLLSYFVRFLSGWFAVPLGVPAFQPYLLTSLVLLVIWAGIFYAEGLYDPFHSRIAFVGRTLIGNRCAGFAQLQRHWVLDGEIETAGFFGAPDGRLFVLEKIG